ncbi:Aminomethyltransferase [hydrothermal vent metagenome]|uniref:Aminomethyltransferase n=1 Tax=hydrothermal vent metagenome TaxID=652676 RepID=A0A3B0VGP6_9ZZZZ
MPFPTPFHSRTMPLVENYEWRDWAGYIAPSLYEPSHEREYFAIRNSAGLIDITPLFKYDVTGPDALRLVDRVMTRNIKKCRVGQVMYSPWCDEKGKVIDDGTISRLDENHFRLTAADPSLRWFQDVGVGLDAQVVNVTQDFAGLALQGPNSRAILAQIVEGIDFDKLRYFWLAHGTVDGFPIMITRTGFTGDLGYELWVRPPHAERLWDRLMETGANYGMLPAGMVALDMVRIEAGMLLIGVDYVSSHQAIIESQKSSPYEIGLGWTVKLDGDDFIGRRALIAEKEQGTSEWGFVGLELDWVGLEKLYADEDLPPQVAGRASRDAVPVYQNGKFVGQMTSHTFSPILKQAIGIGTVYTRFAAVGSQLDVEVTVEFKRKLVKATVVKTPFFNPKRKRA